MELVPYTQVRHLIPKKSVYYSHEKSQWANDYALESVWFHDGDFDFSEPLNLDEANRCFRQAENDRFPFFILINGHARFQNIFNAETDGATGLVVLGNLSAENIAVGGQEIFVTGDLNVKDLFWGDYNHGNLHVNGKISARVFLNTDYGTDYKRFKTGENIEIEYLLTDDQEDLYTEGHLLRALFKEEFIVDPKDITDNIYSWKDWFNEWFILESLQNNKPILRQEWNPDFFPKDEVVPDFFENDKIDEKNLLRFSESNLLKPHDEENALILEYWEGDFFRRFYMLKNQPISSTVYLQDGDDVGYMVYMGKRQSLLRKSTTVLATSYRELPDGKWLDLGSTAPETHRAFLHEQWKVFIEQYTQMHYWWNRYKTEVTAEKVKTILDLPLIREKHHDYYDDNNPIFFSSFQWSFRVLDNSKGRCPRISIIRELPDENFDFYLYDIEDNDMLELYTQDKDGYDADVFIVPQYDYKKFRNAVHYFEKLEKHIFRLNEEYRQLKDIEINRFDLTKSTLASLVKLCLSEPHLAIVTHFIEKTTEAELEKNVDLFDTLRFFCEEKDIPFLINLDWKAETEDFVYFLDRILKENFGLETDLNAVPVSENWSLDKVMQQYDGLLRTYGLQLGFANDYTDSYVFFVHRTEAAPFMNNLLELTEYEYQEAQDL